MARIAQHVERSPNLYFPTPRSPLLAGWLKGPASSAPHDLKNHHAVANAVSHAACQTAHELGAAAIITPTSSGYTASMVAQHRPAMPVVATPHNPRVQRQLKLQWGVYPLLARRAEDTDQTIAEAVRTARSHRAVKPGDTVVVTAGSADSGPGTTNIMKVQLVGGT